MKTVTLEAFRDEQTGELGLGIVGVSRGDQTNAASSGDLLAHDLIEHVNGLARIGSIDDELEALGAIWYVRGQHGELNRDGRGSMHSVESNIASDVTRMFVDWQNGADLLINCTPRTCKCDADEALQEILAHADRTWRGEFSDNDAEEIYRRPRDWQRYRRHALALMRIGYRKAYRKWERLGSYAANSQYWAIAEACDREAKSPEFEGARYTLRYGNGEAFLEQDYGDDY